MLDRQAEFTSRSEDPQNPGQSGSEHVRWHASHHTSTSSDKACWSFDPEKDLAIMPRCQLVQKLKPSLAVETNGVSVYRLDPSTRLLTVLTAMWVFPKNRGVFNPPKSCH